MEIFILLFISLLYASFGWFDLQGKQMVTLIILPENLSDLSDVIGGIFPDLDHAFVSTGFKITATLALIIPFKLFFFHAVMYDHVSPNCGYKIAEFSRFLYAKSCYIPLDHGFNQLFQFVISY